jgi:hypothetical protein
MYCFMVFNHVFTAMYFILSQVCYLYSYNTLQSIIMILSTTDYLYPHCTLCTNIFLHFAKPNNFSKLLLLSRDLQKVNINQEYTHMHTRKISHM